MKSVLAFLIMSVSLTAFSFPLPETAKVVCDILQADRADAKVEMVIETVASCEALSQAFPVGDSGLALNVGYSAACQRPHTSYPEHITIWLEGSGVYARAFTLAGEYPKALSLQVIVPLKESRPNVITHCRIQR